MSNSAACNRAANLEQRAERALETGNTDAALDLLDEAEDLYTTGNQPEDAGRVRARIEEVESTHY